MKLRGTNSDEASRYNQRVVLEMVRRDGPVSRAEIARATGLVSQTISNIAGVLLGADLILEERRPGVQPGQPPQYLSINPHGRYSVGISIERRWLVVTVADFSGKPVGTREIAIADYEPDRVLHMASDAVADLLTKYQIPREKLLGAGLAMSGLNENGSFVNLANEYSWRNRWREQPFVSYLEGSLGVPIFMDADRTAAAIGERMNGIGKSYANYIYVFFGAGLGAGLIFSGLPYRGSHGKAGEIGHMVIEAHGRPCPCGNHGCLEQYVSLQSAQSAVTNTQYASEPFDAEFLSNSLRDKDPAMLKWVDEAAFYLNAALVSLENMFDCETVLIGGLIPEDLLDALITKMRPMPPSLSASSSDDTRRLVKAATGGHTVAVGAAALPLIHATFPDLQTIRRHGALTST